MKFSKKLLHYIPGIYGYVAATVLIGLLAGTILILQNYLLSMIIAGVFLARQSLPQVWPLLLLFIMLVLIRVIMTIGNALCAHAIARQLKLHLRERLLARICKLGPTYLSNERSGELVSTMTEGIEALDPYFSQYLPQVFLAILLPALMLITIFIIDVPSGIILLIMVPMLPFLLAIVGIMAKKETERHWKMLSLMSAHFLDMLQGLTTLKLLGRSEAEVERIRIVSDHFRQTTMGTLKIAFFSSLVLEEGATISTAIIAVEIGLRLITGQLAFQPALFVLLLTPEFFQPLRQLGAKYHAGMTGTNAAQRIITLLETVPATQQSTQQPAANLFAQPPTICFAQVTYAYEEQQRPALGDISLQINSGQKVALIGPSGAGKSTLTHLLLRFINPDSGTISCNGTPLAEMSPASWRSQIAWVPQHPYLFDESIAANIRLGNTSATFEQVVTAAQQANIHEFILSLPQGYATRIGERGTRLSGGEAQRISLARAFLKNAPLLILDEATSYIDIENETAILEALARLKQGRTVIMIAHHLSTIYDADQIIVLDKGRIVETGTHQMLSQRSGVYHELLAAHKGKEA